MERFEEILAKYGLEREEEEKTTYKYIKAGANKLLARKRKQQVTDKEWNEQLEKIFYAIFSFDGNPIRIKSAQNFLRKESALNKLPKEVVAMISLGTQKTLSGTGISATINGSYKGALGESLKTEKGRAFGEEIVQSLKEEEKIKALFNEEIKKIYIARETLGLLKKARTEIEKEENTEEMKRELMKEIDNWLKKQIES